jgi:hypothetical protein
MSLIVLVLQTCGLSYVGLLGMRAELWRKARCVGSYWWKHGGGRNSGFCTITMEDIKAQRLGDKPTNGGIIRLPGPTPLSP